MNTQFVTVPADMLMTPPGFQPRAVLKPMPSIVTPESEMTNACGVAQLPDEERSRIVRAGPSSETTVIGTERYCVLLTG